MDDVIVEELESLPEFLAPLKSLFKPVEGGTGFKLVLPREDTAGLKSAKAKIERERNALQTQYDALKEALTDEGEDLSGEETLTELKALRRKNREDQGKELVPKTELARIKRETEEALGKKHKTDLDGVRTENAGLKASLEKVLIEDGLRKEAADKDFPTPLKTGAIGALIKIARADNAFKIVDGAAVHVNAEGVELTPKEWLIEQIAANPYLAEEPTGSGTPAGDATRARVAVGAKLAKDMTDEERIAFIRAKGAPAWSAKLMKERKLKAA